ncbi:MAG: hypothetical protein HY953_06820, partial [Candidatus Rokubacteria bacterium]|nr:hypothetical protein [Candidatus Rokubacteria bacterium]
MTEAPMVILGINETHCATAAVLKDGKIVGCASDERFTRVKNDAGYPRREVDAHLAQLGLAPRDIDAVGLAGARMAAKEWLDRVLQDEAYIREYYGVRLPSARRVLEKRFRKLGAKFGLIDASRGKFGIPQAERLALVTAHLGIGPERIRCLDHHTCHAAAAYFGSPYRGAPALVLTNDNSGDGLCATVSTAQGQRLTRHEATSSAPGSLGALYSFVTLYLGMKFGEHEYKVMGLAPYASRAGRQCAYEALKEIFDLVEGTPCRFEWKKRGERYQLLLRACLGLRFDWVAGGAQELLEEILVRWVRIARSRRPGSRLALGGGVFMNVKANM